MLDARRFSAIVVDGKYLVTYDRNSFQRDTAIGTWKQRWVVLRKCCAGITMDVQSADIPFIRGEQEVSYCCRLQNDIVAKMEVMDGVPQLWCWFCNKPYTSHYLIHG